MKNKVKFNLKNVHYAMIAVGEAGSITFGTPKHIPGACSFTMDAQGSEEKFMADGVLYYTSYTNEGYSGTLTMALIPDEFRKDVFGDVEDPTDHVLMEYANPIANPFALLYEIDGDQKGTRRVMYNCSAGRIGENADGQAPRTPQTEAMQLTAAPLANGLTRARTMDNTTDTVFNNWFKNVWLPTTNASAETVQGKSVAQEV